VSHPFFGELANYIEYYAYQHGSKIMLCNSHLDPVKEREYIDMMSRNRVDGIIMGSHTLEVDVYKNVNGPIVTFDRRIDEHIPYISSDNRQGGQLAAQLLTDKGCRKIAHICGNLELQLLANLRTDGFTEVVRGHGIEPVVIQTDMNVFDQAQYERIIDRLFQEHPDVDGVFATSDIIAAFVVKACRRLGKQVPRDVKVVGYDDVNAATWLNPSLTTVRQPLEEMSRLAVDIIRKQTEGEPVRMDNVLPVALIERETT
jgi:LacI family sucrose operon transcriptional repressor